MTARRWNGLVLSIIVVGVVHLTAATNAGRMDEQWPLSGDPGSADRSVAMLQLRANLTLERLVQSARNTAEPL